MKKHKKIGRQPYYSPKLSNALFKELATDGVRLNKYVAHCGICSRRKAGELIQAGLVKVNGKVELEIGFRVKKGAKVQYKGKPISPQRQMVYVLLNKPKNVITTTEDPQGRKTVMGLVRRASDDRLYPVGRLDRMTTGLILLTNDGDLAQKLSHPSYEVRKLYHVFLDKPLSKRDMESIIEGVTLEDGKAIIDRISYANQKDKSEVGIQLHIGRNRIVRRIFEHLGYEVKKLDRVLYAGLTKKDIPRGRWRYLTEEEVILLKHFKP